MKENTGWKKDNCDIHKFPDKVVYPFLCCYECFLIAVYFFFIRSF